MQTVGQPPQGITAKPWPAWLPTQDLSTAYGYPQAVPPTRPGAPGSPSGDAAKKQKKKQNQQNIVAGNVKTLMSGELRF